MDRELFVKIVEESFGAYYDVFPTETEKLPLAFRGDFHKRDEHYWLSKSMPIWGSDTCEYAYVFSAESFDPALAESCISWALEDGLPRVEPSREHHHTDIKVVLIADHINEETRKAVRKRSFTKSYHHSLWGFTNLLAATVDLGERKVCANRAGHDLETYFRKLFDVRKEEG